MFEQDIFLMHNVSPDGRWIAFTGTYDGNADVYVVAAAGGQPRRLTWARGSARGSRRCA